MNETSLKAPVDIFVVGLVSGGHFFSHFYGLVLPPLFAFMAVDLEVGYGELGLLLSAMAAASAVTQVPAGIIVDRCGPVWPLIAGICLRAGAILLMGITPSYWGFLALAVVSGAGNSVFHPANYSILSTGVRARWIGRAFSVHTFAGHLGWAAAPVFTGFFAVAGSWRNALIATGLAGLAMGLVLLLQQGRLRQRAHFRDPGNDHRELQRNYPFLACLTAPVLTILIVFLLDALAMKGFQTFFIPVLMTTHSATVAAASALLSLFFAGSALGILLGGFLADRTPHHRAVAALSLVVTALLITTMGAMTTTNVFFFILAVVTGLCHGLLPPFRDMIVRSMAPRHATGRVFAIVSTGFDIGSALAPLLFAVALDAEKPMVVFWIAAACLAAAGGSVVTELCKPEHV